MPIQYSHSAPYKGTDGGEFNIKPLLNGHCDCGVANDISYIPPFSNYIWNDNACFRTTVTKTFNTKPLYLDNLWAGPGVYELEVIFVTKQKFYGDDINSSFNFYSEDNELLHLACILGTEIKESFLPEQPNRQGAILSGMDYIMRVLPGYVPPVLMFDWNSSDLPEPTSELTTWNGQTLDNAVTFNQSIANYKPENLQEFIRYDQGWHIGDAVEFDFNDYLESNIIPNTTGSSGDFIASGSLNLFIVAEPSSGNANNNLISFFSDSPTSGSGFSLQAISETSHLGQINFSGTNNQSYNFSYDNVEPGPSIYCLGFLNYHKATLTINGKNIDKYSGILPYQGYYKLGSGFEGKIYQVLGVSDFKDSSFTTVNGVLAQKWGITNKLPSGNPYYEPKMFRIGIESTTQNIYGNFNAGPSGTIENPLRWASGALARISATPNRGYRFSGWTSDGTEILNSLFIDNTVTSGIVSSSLDINQANVLMTGDILDVTPVFEALPQYTLDISGSGTHIGSGAYFSGETISISSSNSNTGYKFEGWESGVVENAFDPDTTITLTGNTTLNAKYRAKQYYNVFLNGEGTQFGAGSFIEDSFVYVFATTSEDSTFSHWSVENGDSPTFSTYSAPYSRDYLPSRNLTFKIVEDITLRANYIKKQYTFNTEIVGQGSISGIEGSNFFNPESKTYENQDVLQITGVPANDFIFSHWESGTSIIHSNPIDVLISGDTNLSAKFLEIFDLSYETHAGLPGLFSGGYVSASHANQIYEDQSLNIQAIPNSGFEFQQWVHSGSDWLDEDDDFDPYNPNLSLTVKGDIHLEGYFKKINQGSYPNAYMPFNQEVSSQAIGRARLFIYGDHQTEIVSPPNFKPYQSVHIGLPDPVGYNFSGYLALGRGIRTDIGFFEFVDQSVNFNNLHSQSIQTGSEVIFDANSPIAKDFLNTFGLRAKYNTKQVNKSVISEPLQSGDDIRDFQSAFLDIPNSQIEDLYARTLDTSDKSRVDAYVCQIGYDAFYDYFGSQWKDHIQRIDYSTLNVKESRTVMAYPGAVHLKAKQELTTFDSWKPINTDLLIYNSELGIYDLNQFGQGIHDTKFMWDSPWNQSLYEFKNEASWELFKNTQQAEKGLIFERQLHAHNDKDFLYGGSRTATYQPKKFQSSILFEVWNTIYTLEIKKWYDSDYALKQKWYLSQIPGTRNREDGPFGSTYEACSQASSNQFCIKQDIPSALPYTTQAKTTGFPNGITAKQLWEIIVDLLQLNANSSELTRAHKLFVHFMDILASNRGSYRVSSVPKEKLNVSFFDPKIWLEGVTDLLDLMFDGNQSLRDAHSHLSYTNPGSRSYAATPPSKLFGSPRPNNASRLFVLYHYNATVWARKVLPGYLPVNHEAREETIAQYNDERVFEDGSSSRLILDFWKQSDLVIVPGFGAEDFNRYLNHQYNYGHLHNPSDLPLNAKSVDIKKYREKNSDFLPDQVGDYQNVIVGEFNGRFYVGLNELLTASLPYMNSQMGARALGILEKAQQISTSIYLERPKSYYPLGLRHKEFIIYEPQFSANSAEQFAQLYIIPFFPGTCTYQRLPTTIEITRPRALFNFPIHKKVAQGGLRDSLPQAKYARIFDTRYLYQEGPIDYISSDVAYKYQRIIPYDKYTTLKLTGIQKTYSRNIIAPSFSFDCRLLQNKFQQNSIKYLKQVSDRFLLPSIAEWTSTNAENINDAIFRFKSIAAQGVHENVFEIYRVLDQNTYGTNNLKPIGQMTIANFKDKHLIINWYDESKFSDAYIATNNFNAHVHDNLAGNFYISPESQDQFKKYNFKNSLMDYRSQHASLISSFKSHNPLFLSNFYLNYQEVSDETVYYFMQFQQGRFVNIYYRRVGKSYIANHHELNRNTSNDYDWEPRWATTYFWRKINQQGLLGDSGFSSRFFWQHDLIKSFLSFMYPSNTPGQMMDPSAKQNGDAEFSILQPALLNTNDNVLISNKDYLSYKQNIDDQIPAKGRTIYSNNQMFEPRLLIDNLMTLSKSSQNAVSAIWIDDATPISAVEDPSSNLTKVTFGSKDIHLKIVYN